MLTSRTHIPAFVLALLATFSLLLASCGSETDTVSETDAPGETGERLSVVATTGMIADLAREIAGDRAEVVGLIGPGIDPHLYAPTRSDLERLRSADLVLINGNRLEGRMESAFDRAEESGKTVVRVTERLDPEVLLGSEDYPSESGVHDPHVWMDPALWLEVAGLIEASLIEQDPEGESAYARNADTYRAEFAELISYADEAMSSIPEGQRVLVTAHDAFRYFGRKYDCEVVGIQGISTESEAGVRDIERIVDLLAEREIGAVFVESTVSDRNVRAIIDGCESRGHEVRIGGELFSDAMGEEGTYEGTYLGMIDHNVTTISRALGGEAPEAGYAGKLSQ